MLFDARIMENLRDTILEHIKNKESLNPTQISILEDRLSHIVSQLHTPDHPPYAAMIHRAIGELKRKGGSSEKSISEFIQREYDDLPWAHSSLLKHHLGLLSEHGEITLSRGCRYSAGGAGLRKASIKGGKKHRRKKSRWKFERKRTKRLKLVIHAKESQDVIETVTDQNGELQTPEQNGTIGTVPLQLTDGGEDDICIRSKAMDIDPPLLELTYGLENQAVIDQKQQELHSTSNVGAIELPAWSPNEDTKYEDAKSELSSPERPPGFEFMEVEASTFPSEKDQQRKALPTPVAEELGKADLPCPLQPIRKMKEEKKKGLKTEGRRLKIVLGENEIVLALPRSQEGSPTVNVLPSSENSGKCPPVKTTPNAEKSRVLKKSTSKFTIITRRNTKLSSFQRQHGAQSQPVSIPLSPSMDVQQDEESNPTTLLDDDTPLKKYQRRGRRSKDMMVQDESPLADIQKQQADEQPRLQGNNILQEKTSEETLAKEFTLPNKDKKGHQLQPSKLRLRFRPLKRNLDVNKEAEDQLSTKNKLRNSPHNRACKIQKKS